MKIVLDTNILLDLFLDREPFVESAAELISAIDAGQIEGGLVATKVTTIHYFLTKYLEQKQAMKYLRQVCSVFDILPVNRSVIENSLASKFVDFEDAVIHEAACFYGAQAIITRNKKHFKKSSLAIHTAEEFLNLTT